MSQVNSEISVVMSVYNGENFLSEAVESILNQTFENFEFIIISDGSTDKSSEILNSYAQQDSRIILVEQRNMGLVVSLNKGLEQARAPLIARMDADDVSLPHRLQTQKNYMDENLNIGVLGSAIIPINEQGIQGKALSYPPVGEKLDHYIYHYGSPLAHPSVMMRRDLVIEQGSYRQEFKHAEDYDLWLRLHKVSNIDNLAEPLLQYRQHSEKISIYHAEEQAVASVMARYISKNNLNHCDFEKIMAEANEIEKNKIEWEVIDVMAGSLLFSPDVETLEKYENKCPQELLNNHKDIAVRVFSKFTLTAIKIRNYGLAVKYLTKSFCISPYKTLALILEKILIRFK